MISRALRPLGMTVLTLAALAGAATCASASARTARVWFPRNRLPLAHATRLGAPKPSQRMVIGIGFKDPHPAAEQALMAAQQDPASAQYHHFLTPAQYTARFAVSRPAFTRALAWLHAGGALCCTAQVRATSSRSRPPSPRSTSCFRPRSAAIGQRGPRSWPTRPPRASPPDCTC